jgi:citrate lyase subunit gamma (acyl carrier protein)
MKPLFASQSGSFESSDLIVLIEPKDDHTGRKIEIESIVMLQYG